MKISEIINERMENLNELADLLGVNPFFVGCILKGQTGITLNELDKVFDVYGIELTLRGERKKLNYEVQTEIEQNTFKNYCYYWFKTKKMEVKESTYMTYYHSIKVNLIPYLGNLKLEQIDSRIFQPLIYKLHDNGKKSKSIKDVIILLKMIIKHGQEEGVIKQFVIPKLKYPKDEIIKNKEVYTKDEIAKIVSKCYEEIENGSDYRYTCLGILTLAFTGMRIGELCALQFKDIDLHEKMIHVEKTMNRISTLDDENKTKVIFQTPKTETSIRDIPIHKELLKVIKELKLYDDDYIVCGRKKAVEPRVFRERYKKFIKSLNIDPIKPHGLRHTFATLNIESGADIKTISELLGHSDVGTTLNIYTHATNESKANAIKKYTSILNEKRKRGDKK